MSINLEQIAATQGGDAGKLIPHRKPTAQDYRKLATLYRQLAEDCERMGLFADAGCAGASMVLAIRQTHDMAEGMYRHSFTVPK